MNASRALTEISSLPRDEDGPVFAEPWQANAFTMAVSLNEQGVFSWREWVQIISIQIDRDGDPDTYYHHWLTTLEIMLERKQIISNHERQIRIEQWVRAAHATPHGQPIAIESSK